MKNITKSLIALFAILSLSCNTDDVEDRPVVTGIDTPVLQAPEDGNIYTLVLENASNQAERFVWTDANYNGAVEITYTVEMDLAGAAFANAQSLGSAIAANQLSVSVETMNTAALNLGAEAFEAAAFEVRVKSTIGAGLSPMYSNTASITVMPYVAIPPKLFLVGAPQQYYGLNQWDNTTALEMRYIGDGTTKIFEAYVQVASGEGFKFIGEQGTWDNGNFGTIGGNQNGTLENSGGSSDIKVAETDGAGLYYVWVNIDNLTYKAIKMNWGIIGSATANGWDGETTMTYNFASNTYSITTALATGEMKFRSSNTGNYIAADAWKFNVGVSNPMVTYNASAGNFPITAGNFTLGLSIGFTGNATVTGL